MTQKQAHKIIKSSKGVSLLCDDWEYEIKDNYVILLSNIFDIYYSISFIFFMKNILNKVPLNKNKIVGSFRFSSIGFINEDEYLLAQDLIRFERIKKKNLKYGYIYLASNGFKYVYLGATDIKKFNLTKYKTDKIYQSSTYHDKISEDEIPF